VLQCNYGRLPRGDLQPIAGSKQTMLLYIVLDFAEFSVFLQSPLLAPQLTVSTITFRPYVCWRTFRYIV
jgi:hypothetical protein